MHDPLKGIGTDFSLRENLMLVDLFESEAIPPEEHWSEQFIYDNYDWSDPEFVKKNRGRYAWVPIKLTRGYFAMIQQKDSARACRFRDGVKKKWQVRIDRFYDGTIKKVYARRHGRKNLGEPTYVYMHRELVGCMHLKGPVDHFNGWGLDNRRGTPKNPVNLKRVSVRINRFNADDRRRVNHGLPRGVEPRGDRYGGIRAKRINNRKAVVYRSKKTWATPEEAARWYQNQMKRLYPDRKNWAYDPKTVNYPVFPPRLESELSARSQRLRARSQQAEETIPF